MTKVIRMYGDYVCPFCFLAEAPLQEAAAIRNVEVEWMPYELKPAPGSPVRPSQDHPHPAWNRTAIPLATQLGITIVQPPITPQPYTHLAFEGYQFAKEHGKGNAYNHQVFKGFFVQGRNIGDPNVLVDLAVEVGLDPEAFHHALQNRTYRERHQQALRHAYEEMGIHQVPALVIGRRFIQGLLTRATLDRAMDEELAALARSGSPF